ncbi:MAG: hypothetical protein DMF10_09375 [Verrucomicrobia bacterium]|nr:MAG: hypothetical protein DMF10_09375 [Verrucomicrobiota bacterium]
MKSNIEFQVPNDKSMTSVRMANGTRQRFGDLHFVIPLSLDIRHSSFSLFACRAGENRGRGLRHFR